VKFVQAGRGPVAIPAAAGRGAVRGRRREPSPRLLGLLLILPSVVVILLVNLYPLAYTVYLSFVSKNLLKPRDLHFVGLSNYIALLHSGDFITALWHSITITCLSVFIQTVAAFGLALMLRRPFAGRDVVRGIYILPWPLPTFVTAFAWIWMLDYNFGLVNHLLQAVGLPRHAFLGTPTSAFVTVMFADVWKHLPWTLVVMIAGLSMVSEELLEAVRVDGGGFVAEIRYAILPSMRSVIALVLVLRTIWTFNFFDLIYLMTGGGPGQATMILPIAIYNTAFQAYRVSLAATMGTLMLVGLGAFSIIYLKLQRLDTVG
jgi:multiple sugar transport system permease protein